MGAANRGRAASRALHLVAIGGNVGLSLKETFLTEGILTDARRRLIEWGHLLLKPTLCLESCLKSWSGSVACRRTTCFR